MIEIKDFSKKYSKKGGFAVENLNLVIPDKSITGLLGANGCGKTTVMKAVCAMHYPTNGRISVTDEKGIKINVSENPSAALNCIGYLPEIPILNSEMKTEEFLLYAAEIKQLENPERKILELEEKLFLQETMNKKIRTLSKGQKQRVSFAQALINNPPNLILDEPTSGLDPSQIIQIRKLIKELSATKAIFMSSHIISEADRLCDTICIMNGGKLLASGTKEEILKKSGTKNLEDAFLRITEKGGLGEKSECEEKGGLGEKGEREEKAGLGEKAKREEKIERGEKV